MNVAIQKILCPIDFSENSEHAMQYALTLAGVFKAELHLLHVMELPAATVISDPAGWPLLAIENPDEFQRACREKLQEVANGLPEGNAGPVTHLTTGLPFMGIIETARECGADLIVMGTHGRTGLAHVLIGSVAEKVVRKAPCPVLTVKHPEHRFAMP